MVWTQADLDAGKRALLMAMKGQSVSFNNRSWTSQDLGKLQQLVATIERAVTVAPTHRLAGFRKGV